MVEIHLYGKLRRYAPDARADRDCVIWLSPRAGETVQAIVGRMGIPLEELYHVFLNGSLLSTRNSMAPWLQYPQARENVWDWGAAIEVKAGDRLGLFGVDMAALVV